MNLGGLFVGLPWGLLALGLCPLLWLLSRRPVGLSAARARLALAARLLAVVLLALALADLRLRGPTRALAVALAVDPSASVSPAEARALRATAPRDRAAREDIRWVDVGAAAATQPLATSLEQQVEAALGVLPADRVRRIVLATDGRETEGDVLSAAARARRAGARVFTIPLGDHPPVDRVAVTGLDAPRLLRAGREQHVGVWLHSAGDQRVTLELLRDGVPLLRREVQASRGPSVHELAVQLEEEGVHELAVRATAQGDAVAENNLWRSLVRVVLPPRVLVVNEQGGSTALAAVYRDAHLHVDEVDAARVPATAEGFEPYQLVVLDELVLTTLAPAQQRALRSWVEERGGGLLTATGMHGLGREPVALREIEPVLPPRAVPDPRPIELILVVDRSGSMMGRPIVDARAAATAAVRALHPDSRVGLVAFSSAADTSVAPEPAGEPTNVLQAIGGLRAAGGTDLAAALEAAARLVTDDDRYLHHVILFSDGESRPGPALDAVRALRERGVTVTAITLGPRSGLMAQLAAQGRGHYRQTRSSRALPALFVREVQFRSAPPTREMAFRPAVASRMGFLEGVDASNDPPLLGYVTAQQRPGALTLLRTPEGSPLLAHWWVGQGQVATWASSTGSRWADGYRNGPNFRRLFGQMAWELMRAPRDEALEMHVDAVPGRADVRRVSVVTPSVTHAVAPLLTLSRGRLAGVPLEVHPAAPGVWEANVAVGEGFVVDARMPSSLEPTAAVGAEQPYPAELRAFGADEPALGALARVGGGRVLARLEEALERVEPEPVLRELRLPLLVAALLAYLASLAARRFSPEAARELLARRKPGVRSVRSLSLEGAEAPGAE